ncbi:MAG: DUF2637 domain-containing protein [Spirochaetes bacterium]|nr:MAG: DUF2637 domain-containing protein [Spirochaetota bacterium]
MDPVLLAAKDRRKARRFFWTWVGMATVLSVAGNASHAAMSAEMMENPWFRIAVGSVPPLMLAMSAEAVTVLYRNTSSKGVVGTEREKPSLPWWFATIGVVLLALAAFALSYAALSHLAVGAGVSPRLSLLYPLTLDLSIAVGLLGLVAVPPMHTSLLPEAEQAVAPAKAPVVAAAQALATAPSAQRPAPSVTAPRPAASPSTNGSAPATSLKPRSILDEPLAPRKVPAKAPASLPNKSNSTEPSPTEHHRRIAEQLVRDKVARRTVGDMARILAMNDAKWSSSRIETAIGAHRDVVRKVVSAGSTLEESGDLVPVSN